MLGSKESRRKRKEGIIMKERAESSRMSRENTDSQAIFLMAKIRKCRNGDGCQNEKERQVGTCFLLTNAISITFILEQVLFAPCHSNSTFPPSPGFEYGDLEPTSPRSG